MTPPGKITEDEFLSKTGQSIGQPMNYADIYAEVASSLPSGSRIVEVGVFKGRSAHFLVNKMVKLGKSFEINLVDPATLSHIIKHIKLLRKYCVFHPVQSTEAAARFQDKSLDFVWIDGNHEYDAVKADISAWLPKIKPGGVLAGHDYFKSGKASNQVIEAVDEMLPGCRIRYKSWWHEVS